MRTGSLNRYLGDLIGWSGPISIARYMAEALGHSEYGYYMRQDPLGADGDFITAPEISQLFGEMIGLWLVQAWQDMGAPSGVAVVELGPGRGTLMADALRAAAVVPAFADSVSIHLVETSPVLKQKQAESLVGREVTWRETASTLPHRPMLLVANEFFDALPIRQFQRMRDGWHERLVDAAPNGTGFRLVLGPASDGSSVPAALRDAPLESVAEVCAPGLAVMAEIAGRLAASGGAALIIDYGQTAPRVGETLQAVRRHKTSDVFRDPGNADLCAYVDFFALAQAAREQHAIPHGPVTQGQFLTRLGVQVRAQRLQESATAAEGQDLRAELERLTDPAQMGFLSKVLAVTGPGSRVPAGFEEAT